ncbi:MAG: PQQ-binding-like beta-propeller repeat protein, partial [Propionicimonas sp.]|nr:PQQ-binding-like beta-propeller repeat protein [Propionicimonas sp.]
SVGGLTVVATTGRRLVAYGAGGQWLWEVPLSDIARVAPVPLGATLVVATLDGEVTGLDLASGAEAWRTQVAAEVRDPLVTAGDRLLVADQSGALTCLDAAGSELWAVDAGAARSVAVSSGASPVVVVGREDSPVVRGYALADGERVWELRHYDDAREIVAIGDRFLLRDTDRSTAVDAATGAPAWTWSQQRSWAAVGGGDRVLLLTDTDLVLLDDAGAVVGRWPHALGDVSQSSSFLAAAEGLVVAYGPLGMTVGRLP